MLFQGGRLALDPLRLSKLGMDPVLVLSSDGMGPFLASPGDRISTLDRRGTFISISFLGLSPPFGVKNIEV